MSNTLKFKAKLTVLLAVIGLQEFALNANNRVEIDIDQAFAINDALENKDAEINGLKEEKEGLENKVEELNKTITELQAKIEKTPGAPPANPKGGDNITGEEEEDKDLDPEVKNALHNYNKEMGVYR